jgi:hypothetical protein
MMAIGKADCRFAVQTAANVKKTAENQSACSSLRLYAL